MSDTPPSDPPTALADEADDVVAVSREALIARLYAHLGDVSVARVSGAVDAALDELGYASLVAAAAAADAAAQAWTTNNGAAAVPAAVQPYQASWGSASAGVGGSSSGAVRGPKVVQQ